MVNLKSFMAGAGLSVMLASGALALTPVSGEVLRPEGAPKSAPTWQEFRAENGRDTLYGVCSSFLAAAGLAKQYAWTDCAGVVVKLNGQEKFLPGYLLRQGTSYLFPVAVDPSTGQVKTSSTAAAAPEVSGAQMAADIAQLREIVEGNLPGMADAIRGNTAALTAQGERIDGVTSRVDENAQSLAELLARVDGNTAALTAQGERISAVEVTAGQAFTAAERSNWALLAAAGAALVALLAIVIAMLRHRKLPQAVTALASRIDGVKATAQQAVETAEQANVKASSVQQAQTGLGIDWDASTTPDLASAGEGESVTWTLKVDGQTVNVTFTKLADGRMGWNVPRKDQPSVMRDPLKKVSKAAVQHKLQVVYDDDCLEAMKQPPAVSAVAA